MRTLHVVVPVALAIGVWWWWSHRAADAIAIAESEDLASPQPRIVKLSDGTTFDPERRAAVRKAIYEAWGRTPPLDPRASGLSFGEIPREAFTKAYVSKWIHEDYFPLAKDCYEKVLATKPELEGTLVLSFSIVGNKAIGGIVEAVNVEESSTLNDPKTIECLRESMYTVAFDAPPGDGFVTVTYPIRFAPDDASSR